LGNALGQRGPTKFDLLVILQKPENLRATFIKMMCKTTDSQDLKLIGKKRVIKILQNFIIKFYKILHNSNLLQISIRGCLWLRLLWHYRSYTKPNMLVAASGEYCPVLRVQFDFCF